MTQYENTLPVYTDSASRDGHENAILVCRTVYDPATMRTRSRHRTGWGNVCHLWTSGKVDYS